MRTYFIEIGAIDSAAKILNLELTANYAALGALGRFCGRDLGEVEVIPGIEDMKERAESFRFGTLCGRVIEKYLKGYSAKELAVCEAGCFRAFVSPGLSENEKASAEEKKATLKIVIEAFIKRAQIRTHTAKPGFEDINTWLDRYNQMQAEYRADLDSFVEMVVEPDQEERKLADVFVKKTFVEMVQEIVQEYRRSKAQTGG